jgi:hypothetical protein
MRLKQLCYYATDEPVYNDTGLYVALFIALYTQF